MTPAWQSRAGACAVLAALPVRLSWWFPRLCIPEPRGDFGREQENALPVTPNPPWQTAPAPRGPHSQHGRRRGAGLGREGGDK